MYGLLRLFCESRLAGVDGLSGHMASFRALCKVVDLLLSAKRRLVPPEQAAVDIGTACERFLSSHLEVYGEDLVRPKHHWLLDIASQVRHHGMILDAFIIERQHLLVKALAEHIRNATVFEVSCMASVVTRQLQASRGELATVDGIVGNATVLPGEPGTWIAEKLAIFGVEVSVGDVVHRGGDVGLVKACAEAHGTLAVYVEVLDLIAAVTDTAGKHAFTGRLELWSASEIVLRTAWRMRPDGNIFVCRM